MKFGWIVIFLSGIFTVVGCNRDDSAEKKATKPTEITQSSPTPASRKKPKASTQPVQTSHKQNFEVFYAKHPYKPLNTLLDGTVLMEKIPPGSPLFVRLERILPQSSQEQNLEDHATLQVPASGKFQVAINFDSNYQLTFYSESITTATTKLSNSSIKTKPFKEPPYLYRKSVEFSLPQQSTITGKVVDENNNPLPNSTIAYSARQTYENRVNFFDFATPTTKASADGSFELKGIPQGNGYLTGLAEGYTPSYVGHFEVPTTVSQTITMKKNGATIRGKVLHAITNQTVPNAKITLKLPSNSLARHPMLPYLENLNLRSDMEGGFTIKNLPISNFLYFAESENPTLRQFQDAPEKTQGISITRSNETKDVTLFVYEGHSVTGNVINKDTMESLAEVTLTTNDSSLTATSNLDGKYLIGPIFRDTQIIASLPGYLQNNPLDKISVKDTENTTVAHNITMQQSIKLIGTVKNKEGQPIANAKVYKSRPRSKITDYPPAFTDEDGKFEFDTEPSSKVNVLVYANGYGTKTGDVINTSINDITNYEVIMEPGITISGQVLKGNDIPANNVTLYENIYFETPQGRAFFQGNNVRSDGLGNFTLSELSPNSLITIYDNKLGTYTEELLKHQLSPGQVKEGVIFYLGEKGEISGTLKTQKGLPVPKATIVIETPLATNITLFTDSNGRFYYSSPNFGDHRIYSLENRFPSKIVPLGTKNIVLYVNDDDIANGVTKEKGNSKLIGLVVNKTTQIPVDDFDIKINPVAGSIRKSSKGNFTVSNLVEGRTYTFQITTDSNASEEFKVTVPNPSDSFDYTFEMPMGGLIKGVVKDFETKAPVPNVEIQNLGSKGDYYKFLHTITQPFSVSVTDEKGEFTINHSQSIRIALKFLPPPPYVLHFETSLTREGDTFDMGTVYVSKGSIINGTIESSEDTKYTGENVKLVGLGSRQNLTAVIDSDNNFQFVGLVPDDYEISFKGAKIKTAVEPHSEKSVLLSVGNVTIIPTFEKNPDQYLKSITFTDKHNGKSKTFEIESSPTFENMYSGEFNYKIVNPTNEILGQGHFTIPEHVQEFPYTFSTFRGKIEGEYLSPDGTPISDAKIITRLSPDESNNYTRFMNTTSTDGSGKFIVGNLPPGAYSIRAESASFGNASKENIEIKSGPIKVRLTSPTTGGTIECLTINGATGKPVQGGTLILSNEEGELSFVLNRDSNGVARLNNVAEGNYRATINLPHFTQESEDITIYSGEIVTLDHVIYPSGSIVWTLKLSDESPAAGIEVNISTKQPKGKFDIRTVRSNSSGTCLIYRLSENTYTATATYNGQVFTKEFQVKAHQLIEESTTVKEWSKAPLNLD